ncbi:MAG: signal peptidase II [Clostridia bacterium]|nr:signal peptidase II [Clostridia bacterium]
MQRTGADGRKLTAIILPALLIILILVDQIVKTYFKNEHDNNGFNSLCVIQGFFYFTYTFNTGAAFSFLSDKPWAQTFFAALTVVALIVFYVIYLYCIKKNKTLFLKLSLIFIIAGTLGNFIDRIYYKGVVDFLSFIFFGKNFAIFNIADAYMTVGVIMLFISVFFIEKDAIFKKSEKKNDC